MQKRRKTRKAAEHTEHDEIGLGHALELLGRDVLNWRGEALKELVQ